MEPLPYGLLEALRLSGERNCATVERLGQYLRDRVPQLCEQYGKLLEQRPRIGADSVEKLHFILQPNRATLADIALMKEDVYEAEVGGNLELAEQIWIRVIVAAQGRDMKALRALQRIERLRSTSQTQQQVVPLVADASSKADTQGSRDSSKIISDKEPRSPNLADFQNEMKKATQSMRSQMAEMVGLDVDLKLMQFEVVTVGEAGKVVSQKPGQAAYFEEDLGGGVVLEMVRIPAGKFVMGSPEHEEGRLEGEGPQHEVTVTEFFMGQFAITQVQYEAVIGKNPSKFKGQNRPVECVTWRDAVAFCKKLSAKSGKLYRLPSEAEWEYACRAGTTTPFYFGETLSTEVANYCGNYTYGQGTKGKYRKKTIEVSSLPANGFGLYEMHGNVWEWCEDEWHDSYEGAPTDGSAWVTSQNSDQSLRLLRGSSWGDGPGRCRSAIRRRARRDDFIYLVGFRVACSPPRT